jgi:hypothetical protein
MCGGNIKRDEGPMVRRIVSMSPDRSAYLGRDLKTGDVYIDAKDQRKGLRELIADFYAKQLMSKRGIILWLMIRFSILWKRNYYVGSFMPSGWPDYQKVFLYPCTACHKMAISHVFGENETARYRCNFCNSEQYLSIMH